jgi:hypothetical protein
MTLYSARLKPTASDKAEGQADTHSLTIDHMIHLSNKGIEYTMGLPRQREKINRIPCPCNMTLNWLHLNAECEPYSGVEMLNSLGRF